jgi:protein-tyrosine phosphatase
LDILDDPKPTEAHKAASNALPYIIEANAAVKKATARGKATLIHCYGSNSRSAVLIIANIMETKRISAEEATAILKGKWDAVSNCVLDMI